jgi:hypothetical protein
LRFDVLEVIEVGKLHGQKGPGSDAGYLDDTRSECTAVNEGSTVAILEI